MTPTVSFPAPAPGETPRKRRGRAKIALVVVLALVAVLVAVGVGSEFYLRHRVSDCLARSVEQSVGSDVDVTISSKPMLLQMLDGTTPYVEVTSAEPRFGGAEGMELTLRLNDVRSSGGQATAGSSAATVTWTAEGIARTFQNSGVPMVSEVKADPANQTLGIALLGQLANITAKPQISGDTIEVEVMTASLLGGLIGIPTELPQQIVDTLTKGLSTFPLDLKPTSLTVTDTGITVELAGGPTSLSAADTTGQQRAAQQQQVSCSLL